VLNRAVRFHFNKIYKAMTVFFRGITALKCNIRLGTFRPLGDWVFDKERQMKFTWKQLFGLGVGMLLFGSGVWANVADGSLSQNKGAWVSHAVK
jgi:hypothetical protein